MSVNSGNHDTDPTAVAAQERALREAVDWSILLDDDASDSLLQMRFQAWLARAPLHAWAWERTTHVSSLLREASAQARPAPAMATAPAAPVPRTRPWRRRLRRGLLPAAATAAVAWLVLPMVLLHARADYLTGADEQRTVALDDGSTVRLAPGSAIQVDYARQRRQVRLLAGEAYFEVRPDPAHPFRVDTPSLRVTVLGTGFDVRLGGQTQEVAVRHGRVRVESLAGLASFPRVLVAGQWTRAGEGGTSEGGSTLPELVGTWSGQRLSAIDRPLADVLADLRRYYHGRIVLTDPALGQRRVTGVFDVADPAHAAQLIVQPHGGVVRRVTPWVLVVSGS